MTDYTDADRANFLARRKLAVPVGLLKVPKELECRVSICGPGDGQRMYRIEQSVRLRRYLDRAMELEEWDG